MIREVVRDGAICGAKNRKPYGFERWAYRNKMVSVLTGAAHSLQDLSWAGREFLLPLNRLASAY